MRLFHRFLLVGVLNVIARPRFTLLIAALVLAASSALAMWKLNISTDQNKLFDPNVHFFRDYLSFTQNFPENEAIYLLIQPIDSKNPPIVSRWTNLADALTEKLRAMPKYVNLVDQKVPLDKLGKQGVLFDSPKAVQQNFEDIKRFIQ